MFLTMVGILGLMLGFSKLRDYWKNLKLEEIKEKRRVVFFQREKQILNEIRTHISNFNYLKAREITNLYKFVKHNELNELTEIVEKNVEINRLLKSLDKPNLDYYQRHKIYKSLSGLEPDNDYYSEQLNLLQAKVDELDGYLEQSAFLMVQDLILNQSSYNRIEMPSPPTHSVRRNGNSFVISGSYNEQNSRHKDWTTSNYKMFLTFKGGDPNLIDNWSIKRERRGRKVNVRVGDRWD